MIDWQLEEDDAAGNSLVEHAAKVLKAIEERIESGRVSLPSYHPVWTREEWNEFVRTGKRPLGD